MKYYFPKTWTNDQKYDFLWKTTKYSPKALTLQTGELYGIEINTVHMDDQGRFIETFGRSLELSGQMADCLRAIGGIVIGSFIFMGAQMPAGATLIGSWVAGGVAFATPTVITQQRQKKFKEYWEKQEQLIREEAAVFAVLEDRASPEDFDVVLSLKKTQY